MQTDSFAAEKQIITLFTCYVMVHTDNRNSVFKAILLKAKIEIYQLSNSNYLGRILSLGNTAAGSCELSFT